MQTDEQRIRIKIPVLFPIALAFLVLLSFSILGAFWLQRHNNNNTIRMDVEGARLLYNRYIDTHTQVMSGMLDLIEGNGDLKSAWLAKDRAKLFEFAKPILEDIRSKGNITHLYFHNADRVCFLRVHDPDKYGDFITRATMDQAERREQPAYGAEFGPYGTFTVRVVHPWMINGELSGYIEVGEDVGSILPVLKDVFDVELLVTVSKRYLKRADWEEGMRMMGYENADWDLLSDKVIVSTTFENLSEKSLRSIKKVLEQGNGLLFSAAIADRSYKGGYVSLVNAGHLRIGAIVVLKDVTQMKSALKLFSVLLFAVCIIVGTILWLLFYAYVLRIESKLTDVYVDLYKQIEKHKKAKEELQQAYNQMELDVTSRTSELSREVAERKRTEHELQELNAELEMTINRLTEANHELEQFAFITSHHLREPVRKISMFGKLLINSLADKLDSDQHENLNFMMDGAAKIEQMVKGLKLYLQVSTEKMEFEDIDLNLILENIKGLSLSDELEQTGAVISVPQKLPVVSGCPAKLHQVIEQIIANGIRYRQQDISPEIVIRAHREDDDDTVRIEIEDNGIGVKEELLQNVFDPFKRLQIEQGTESVGIGLTVCKKIIERHNGQMGIRSVYGKGTTIWFILPLAASEKSEKITVSDSANS